MIKTELQTKVKILDELDAFEELVMKSVSRTAGAIGRDAKADLETALLYSTPPKRKYPDDYPIEWTSERQRKAYFATDGFGAGIPYRRTGKLAQSWEVDLSTRDGMTITVSNPQRAARFVYGTLAKNRVRAMRPQQRFHAITGWELASDIVMPIIEAARDSFLQQVKGQVTASLGNVISKQRATTPRLKRGGRA